MRKKHHVILQQGTCGADKRKSAWYKSEAKKVFPQHRHNKLCSHWQRNQSLFSAADLNTLERWNVRAVEKGLISAAKNDLAGLNLAGRRQEKKCDTHLVLTHWWLLSTVLFKKKQKKNTLTVWLAQVRSAHKYTRAHTRKAVVPANNVSSRCSWQGSGRNQQMTFRHYGCAWVNTSLWWLELAYSSLWVAYIWKPLQRTYMHSRNLISVRFLH